MKKSQLRKLIRENIRHIMAEQISNNPFTGGGSGPNWQAAEAAWNTWNASNQGGAPQPDQNFLNNMAGKGCGFFEKRLTAQINSFVNQFGGSFGNTGSSNPAWQSKKYARIMWLANEVQQCNTGSTGSGNTSTCFATWLNDPQNDVILTSATCANGNQAVNAQNLQSMKFRHQSISDCSMLSNKIADIASQIPNASGCQAIRKQAKHDYLLALKNHCC